MRRLAPEGTFAPFGSSNTRESSQRERIRTSIGQRRLIIGPATIGKGSYGVKPGVNLDAKRTPVAGRVGARSWACGH